MRLVYVVKWVLFSSMIASIYGALHNQISFRISEEYFTKFKFIQFGLINSQASDWIKAAHVGIMASWWVGLIIGVSIGCLVLVFSPTAEVDRFFRRALITVIAASIAGAASCALWTPLFDDAVIPSSVQNIDAFRTAGSLHNGSYLGALFGFFIALFSTVRRLVRRR